MNDNNRTITINGKSIIISVWNNLDDTEIRQTPSTPNYGLNKAIDDTKEHVNPQDNRRKIHALIKASNRFKNVILFIITGISLSLVIQQGSVCISK